MCFIRSSDDKEKTKGTDTVVTDLSVTFGHLVKVWKFGSTACLLLNAWVTKNWRMVTAEFDRIWLMHNSSVQNGGRFIEANANYRINCLFFGQAWARNRKKTPKVLKPPFCILLTTDGQVLILSMAYPLWSV